MRKFLKKIITLFLYCATKIKLWRNNPFVIVIIGTKNRSLTKEILSRRLSEKWSVLTNERQWNSEIGIPLTILRVNINNHSFFGWMSVIIRTKLSVLKKSDQNVYIFEIGFNKRGDLSYMFSLLKPSIVVITDTRETTKNFYHDEMKIKLSEYKDMVRNLTSSKHVILYSGIPERSDIERSTHAQLHTYSHSDKDHRYQIIPGMAARDAHQITDIIEKIL